MTYISIELADKAGKVVVFEVLGEQIFGELGGIPNNEAVASGSPRDDGIGDGIIHHFIGFGKEGRGRIGTSAGRDLHGVWMGFCEGYGNGRACQSKSSIGEN